MASRQLFGSATGYDPAVHEFRGRLAGPYDVVTCLDVLDIVEPRFLDAVLADIAGLTAGLAVIDCLTRPKPGGVLKPHPAFYWTLQIQRHMRVVETSREFPAPDGFERAVIIATSR
jgi:hypothetical protein